MASTQGRVDSSLVPGDAVGSSKTTKFLKSRGKPKSKKIVDQSKNGSQESTDDCVVFEDGPSFNDNDMEEQSVEVDECVPEEADFLQGGGSEEAEESDPEFDISGSSADESDDSIYADLSEIGSHELSSDSMRDGSSDGDELGSLEGGEEELVENWVQKQLRNERVVSDSSSEDSDFVNEYDLAMLGSDQEEDWRTNEEFLEDVDHHKGFRKENVFNPNFELRMVFGSKKLFKEAVDSYAIMSRRPVRYPSNDKERIYAKCSRWRRGCKWHIHARKIIGEESWQIRSINKKHHCRAVHRVKNMTYKWLASKTLSKWRNDPKRSIIGFMRDCFAETQVHISKQQAYRCRREALNRLEGTHEEQYAMLWDYLNELKIKNVGSTVCMDVTDPDADGNRKFHRLYIGLKPLMEGMKANRSCISLDGTFLKGKYKGILLTAVSIDPNNCLYPVAYGIVFSESFDSWDWFCKLLKDDLEIVRDDLYVFMSDKAKGLIPALAIEYPRAEHRFCVRHMISNMREVKTANLKGDEYSNGLWKVAKSTTVPDFEKNLKEFLTLNSALEGWLADKPPKHWCRAYFRESAKCETLLNNYCESFNAVILGARERPVITLLEWIRQYIMRKLQEGRDRSAKHWTNKRICPNIEKLVKENVDKDSKCFPIKSTNRYYEVIFDEKETYTIDLHQKTCSCRRWQLSGIPCPHAMAAISDIEGDPDDYVDVCYTVEKYNAVYAPFLMPLDGSMLWQKTCRVPPLPPLVPKKRGRPSKNRKQNGKIVKKNGTKGRPNLGKECERLERQVPTTKRQYVCKWCEETGHQQRTCKLYKIYLSGIGTSAQGEQTEQNTEVPINEEPQVELELVQPTQGDEIPNPTPSNANTTTVNKGKEKLVEEEPLINEVPAKGKKRRGLPTAEVSSILPGGEIPTKRIRGKPLKFQETPIKEKVAPTKAKQKVAPTKALTKAAPTKTMAQAAHSKATTRIVAKATATQESVAPSRTPFQAPRPQQIPTFTGSDGKKYMKINEMQADYQRQNAAGNLKAFLEEKRNAALVKKKAAENKKKAATAAAASK